MAKCELIAENTGCIYLRGNAIPFYRNTDTKWILMDSGTKRDKDELQEVLDRYGVKVSAVLTSHMHYDHVGNHRMLRSVYGAKRVMSAFDAGVSQSASALQACFYSSTTIEIEENLSEMIGNSERIITQYQRRIMVEGIPFRILNMPGHAASHLGFETPDGVIYLGDSLVGKDEIDRNLLIYMLDWKTSLKTLREIRSFKSPCVLSHGGVVENIAKETDDFYNNFWDKIGYIKSLIDEKSTLTDIVEKVIENCGIPIHTLGKARVVERMIRSYVNYLDETGQVQTDIENGIVIYNR